MVIGARSATPSTPTIELKPVNLRNRENEFDLLFLCPDIDSRLPAISERILKMLKWEYATVPLLLHKEAAILNSWGIDGWELVSVATNAQGGLLAIFKRELA
jgi:hypothetical protein